MIWYLPLEDLEQRYTTMWNAALWPLVDHYLYPDLPSQGEIQVGEFLDVFGTIQFKAAQMQMVATAFREGRVQTGDVFLVADLFYPGIEAIRYMAELGGVEVYMAGYNHAGRADPTDFVQRLGPWADLSEAGYHAIMDVVLVGSSFQAGQVARAYGSQAPAAREPVVTGAVWDRSWVDGVYPADPSVPKGDRVIWPHRCSHEKGFDLLLRFAALVRVPVLVTSCGCIPQEYKSQMDDAGIPWLDHISKARYYEEMQGSRWYLSTARQETFGYTLQEAIHYGCRVLAPSGACYPEMLPPENLYPVGDTQEAARRINADEVPSVPMSYTEQWDGNAELMVAVAESLPGALGRVLRYTEQWDGERKQ